MSRALTVFDPTVCAECETRLLGDFCHRCGQRRLGPEHRRVRYLVGEALASLANLEGRWLRSLWLLVVDTGHLSRAWIEGKRQRYLRPFSLFLLVNVAFFLAPPMTDFDLALADHIRQPVYGEWALELVRGRLADEGMEYEDFSGRFAGASSNVAKSLVILHVPVLALLLWLGLLGRRWTLAEHVVVSLHLFAFLLLAALALGWVVFPVAEALIGTEPSPAVTALPVLLVAWWRGIRRAYLLARIRAAMMLLVAIAGLTVAHFVYRGVQFTVVFWLT